MRLPLYQLPDGLVSPSLARDGNRGLWFDKFCNRWDASWSMKATKDATPKLDWIKTVVGIAGSQDELRSYAHRLFDLVVRRGGEAMIVQARSRFVTGLGRSNPVESGFAWHPTLGTPYLAGSSLKGLTRAWAEANEQDADEVTRLLGTTDRTGTVAFLDAVPPRPVTLEADVLTPHYPNWSEHDPPGDWMSPNPVPFLVAAPGLSLLCGLIPIRASHGDVATVRRWLISAVEYAGAGAKTAVGYGHFQEDAQDATLAAWHEERRRRDAMATPEARWRLELKGLTESELLDAVRQHLIREPLPNPDERRAFVHAVLGTGKIASWKRGDRTDSATSTGAKKLRQYARTVLACAAEFGLEPPR